jgi:hypothetical protein
MKTKIILIFMITNWVPTRCCPLEGSIPCNQLNTTEYEREREREMEAEKEEYKLC